MWEYFQIRAWLTCLSSAVMSGGFLSIIVFIFNSTICKGLFLEILEVLYLMELTVVIHVSDDRENLYPFSLKN